MLETGGAVGSPTGAGTAADGASADRGGRRFGRGVGPRAAKAGTVDAARDGASGQNQASAKPATFASSMSARIASGALPTPAITRMLVTPLTSTGTVRASADNSATSRSRSASASAGVAKLPNTAAPAARPSAATKVATKPKPKTVASRRSRRIECSRGKPASIPSFGPRRGERSGVRTSAANQRRGRCCRCPPCRRGTRRARCRPRAGWRRGCAAERSCRRPRVSRRASAAAIRRA